MAQKVKLARGKEFTFPERGEGRGKESRYPWDEWLNGDLLLLERSDVDEEGNLLLNDNGEPVAKRDFEAPLSHMPGKLKVAARKRYKVVQFSRRDADGNKLENGLIIRARDMTTDERLEEDRLRAEEREALKVKKSAKASSNGSPAVPDSQS